jgi:hypothetical protein
MPLSHILFKKKKKRTNLLEWPKHPHRGWPATPFGLAQGSATPRPAAWGWPKHPQGPRGGSAAPWAKPIVAVEDPQHRRLKQAKFAASQVSHQLQHRQISKPATFADLWTAALSKPPKASNRQTSKNTNHLAP